MISFKLGLASVAAVGTVVVGGGVTYAMVSAPEALPAPPVAAPAPKLPAAPALPDCAPTGVGAPSVPSKLPAGAPRVPAEVPDQVGAEVRASDVEKKAGKVREQAEGATDTVRKNLPAGASDCLPSAPVKVPDAPAVPAPAAPEIPALDCDNVPGAVMPNTPAAQVISGLTGGMRQVSSQVETLKAQGKEVCARVQTFKNVAGQSLTIQRVQGANLEQARHALRLPQAEPLTLGGATFWETPLGGGAGTGIVWSPDPGVSLFVSGSPVFQPQLRTIAMQLSNAG